MKLKSLLVLLLVAFFAIVASSPVFATTQMSPAFMVTEQMPAWLAEAGAVPISDAELELVQGEAIYIKQYSLPWWVSGWKDFKNTLGKGHRIVIFKAYGARTGDQHVLIDKGQRGAPEKNWVVWNFGNNYYGVLVPTSYAITHPFSWWKVVLKDG